MTDKTVKHDKIIAAMVQSGSLKEVSKVTGIPARTLYSILKSPDFKEKLNETKSAMLSQSVTKLNNYAITCVDVLAQIAQDEAQNGQIRVSACRGLLDLTSKLNEQVDIIGRIEALEQRQAENSRN